MKHSELSKHIRKTAPKNARLWNNPRGIAMHGDARVAYGGPPGASDLIGLWILELGADKSGILEFTDFIGASEATYKPPLAAVFMGIELKRPGEAVRQEQRQFLLAAARYGGISIVIRTPEEANELWTQCPIIPGRVIGLKPGGGTLADRSFNYSERDTKEYPE